MFHNQAGALVNIPEPNMHQHQAYSQHICVYIYMYIDVCMYVNMDATHTQDRPHTHIHIYIYQISSYIYIIFCKNSLYINKYNKPICIHYIYIYISCVCVHICIYNEGCLKGIPPSTYLRIIKVLFRHTLSSKKNIFQELTEIYGNLK